MVTHADEYPNPSDGKSTGQGGVPLAPGSEPSTTGPRRRAKWLIGGALVVALFTGGAAGIAVANHPRQIGSAGPGDVQVSRRSNNGGQARRKTSPTCGTHRTTWTKRSVVSGQALWPQRASM